MIDSGEWPSSKAYTTESSDTFVVPTRRAPEGSSRTYCFGGIMLAPGQMPAPRRDDTASLLRFRIPATRRRNYPGCNCFRSRARADGRDGPMIHSTVAPLLQRLHEDVAKLDPPVVALQAQVPLVRSRPECSFAWSL